MMDEPQDGIVYPLLLGSTFLKSQEDGTGQFYHTLQYNFKPASMDTKKSGGVMRKDERGGLEVEITNKTGKNGGNEKVLFKGNYLQSKDIDCILVYQKNPPSFRLERLAGSGKSLKSVRNDPKAKLLPKSELSSEPDTDNDSQPLSSLLSPTSSSSVPSSTSSSSTSITTTTTTRKRSSPGEDGDLDENLNLPKKAKTTHSHSHSHQNKKTNKSSKNVKHHHNNNHNAMVDEVIETNFENSNGVPPEMKSSEGIIPSDLKEFADLLENDMDIQPEVKNIHPPTSSLPTQPSSIASSSIAQEESDSESESASESDSDSSSESSSASDSDGNEKKTG